MSDLQLVELASPRSVIERGQARRAAVLYIVRGHEPGVI
jgi:hypothetical protein